MWSPQAVLCRITQAESCSVLPCPFQGIFPDQKVESGSSALLRATDEAFSNDSPSLLFCRANSLLFNFIAIGILLLDLCDNQDAVLFYFCDNCQTINAKLKEKKTKINNNSSILNLF